MDKPKTKREWILYREGLWQSIIADIVTLAMLCFCIWFSAESKFWNFVCFVMLFTFLLAKNKSRRVHIFRTREQVKEWAAAL